MARQGGVPLADFEGLPVAYYPGLPVEVSRGCYWSRCAFCSRCVVYLKRRYFEGGGVLYRPVGTDEIVRRVRTLQERYGKTHFEFTCLDISPPEMKRLCRAIIDAGLRIGWCARVRLDDSFEPEMLDLMAEAGATSYHLSPETFCARTTKLHNKNYNMDRIRAIFEYWEANRDRLPPLLARLMIGFPGETFDDFKESYDYIMAHHFHVQAISFYSLLKNSDVYVHPEKYGITIRKVKQHQNLFANYEATWSPENQAELEKIYAFIDAHKGALRKKVLFVHPIEPWSADGQPAPGEAAAPEDDLRYRITQFLGAFSRFYVV
ncbi:MAG: radical SAM protein [Lentisphaerae bacterium]|nr:radical SAM protein [Lentisphaerota bacterium]